MPKKKSIIKVFMLITMLLIVLSSVVTGIVTISNDYAEFVDESREVEEEYIAHQKQMIKNEVEKGVDYVRFMHSMLEERVRRQVKNRVYEAHAIARNLFDKNVGKVPLARIKDMTREALRPIRFLDGRGYFFAVSLDGIEELFADRPDLEGKDMLATQDTEGQFVIRDMIRIVREKGEGFYEYTWTKPGHDERSYPKIAYLKLLEPLNWLIGTGEYLDDMEKDIQQEVLERIARIRFGKDGYIFVVHYNGTTLMNDTQRELIGKNIWDLTDPNGVKVIQEERKAAEKPGGGFIRYVWNKPSRLEPSPKISFIKGYPKWQWMIGAGVYLDDVEKIIAEKKEGLRQIALKHIFYNLVTMALSILVVFLFARFLTRKLELEFEVFSRFFEKASARAETIDLEKLGFEEFQRLAMSANSMVERQQESEAGRKLAEAEKEDMETRLRQSQKMEAIGTLAGGIAHDFNNILSVIIGYADMVREDVRHNPQVAARIDEVLKAGHRARDLVRQILDFSRQSRVERIILKPQPIVKEALKMLRSSLPATIAIEEEIAAGCGAIEADPTQFHQILMNLCTNAFHAMETSGGILRVTLRPAEELPAELGREHPPDRRWIELSVRDTGQGIGPDIVDRIFDPFFTTKEQGKGTGMGLAIAYGIIRDYGGTITVESQVSEGTIFHIFLPVVEGEASTSLPPTGNLPLGNERILFVDDEPMLVDIGRRTLESLGYEVTATASSREALELFRHDPDRFDLVITDQTMPQLTGLELAVRLFELRPDLPVILCTGYSSLVDGDIAKAKGVREFALKPMTKEKIATLIREVLDGK